MVSNDDVVTLVDALSAGYQVPSVDLSQEDDDNPFDRSSDAATPRTDRPHNISAAANNNECAPGATYEGPSLDELLAKANAEIATLQAANDMGKRALDAAANDYRKVSAKLARFEDMMEAQMTFLMQYLAPQIEAMIDAKLDTLDIEDKVSEYINVDDITEEVSRNLDVSDAVTEALSDVLAGREMRDAVRDIVRDMSFSVEVD